MTLVKSSLLGLVAALALVACAPAQSAAPVVPTVAAPASAAPRSEDIVALMRSARTTGYKVTFNLKSQSAGEKEPRNLTAAQYVKLPKTRYDAFVQMNGESAKASVFALEDGRYSCSGMSGSERCMKLPSGRGQPESVFDAQRTVQENPENFDVAPKAARQISGVTAACFTFTPKGHATGAAEAEACFSAEGIPLSYSRKNATGETTMEATSFTRQVSDSDFKLPAPATDMPGRALPPA